MIIMYALIAWLIAAKLPSVNQNLTFCTCRWFIELGIALFTCDQHDESAIWKVSRQQTRWCNPWKTVNVVWTSMRLATIKYGHIMVTTNILQPFTLFSLVRLCAITLYPMVALLILVHAYRERNLWHICLHFASKCLFWFNWKIQHIFIDLFRVVY